MTSRQRVTVVDPLGAPAPFPGRSLQRVAGVGNVTALWRGEEVEILRGAGREVLREQGRSPG